MTEAALAAELGLYVSEEVTVEGGGFAIVARCRKCVRALLLVQRRVCRRIFPCEVGIIIQKCS